MAAFETWKNGTTVKAVLSVWRVDRQPRRKSPGVEAVTAFCTLTAGWAEHNFTLFFIGSSKWEVVGDPQSDGPADLGEKVVRYWVHHVPLGVKSGDVFEFLIPMDLVLSVDAGFSSGDRTIGRAYLHLGYATLGKILSMSPKLTVGLSKIQQSPRGSKFVVDVHDAERDLKYMIQKYRKEIADYWKIPRNIDVW
jgi:hypothetical protein